MLTIRELLGEVDCLPDADKWQLVKHVLNTLEQVQITPASTADYHQFLRETYGVLRDTPIERWDQGEYEERILTIDQSSVQASATASRTTSANSLASRA